MNGAKTWLWLSNVLLALAAAELPAGASPPWFAHVWQSDEGLPDNTVVGVAQTSDGFLWVATQKGLVRFDGARFKEFTQGYSTGGLSSLNQMLLVDRQDRLWLGQITKNVSGGRGGAVVCVDTGQTHVFTPKDGLPDAPVLGMAEDGEGAVWTLSRNFICRFQKGRFQAFSGKEGLPAGGIRHLASDGQGRLWFARNTSVGLFRDGRFHPLLTLKEQPWTLAGTRSGGVWIAAGTRLLRYAGDGDPQDLGELAVNRPNLKPSVLYEDHAGRLWLGTSNYGLFLHKGSAFEEVYTPHHDILSLTEDAEGSLWVGTRGGGLMRLRPSAFELQDLGADPLSETVVSVCQDNRGTLWAVTKGGVLAKRTGKLWKTLSAEDGWSARATATCVTPAPEGGVWVGTRNNGLCWCGQGISRSITKRDGLAGDSVSALFTSPSGDVWIGTVASNALQRLSDGHFQTFLLPQSKGPFGCITVDASGRLWAATRGGLLSWASLDGLVEETTNTLGRHHPINSLCATPDGSLWIGYAGQGLGRLKRGQFTQFGEEQGLFDDYIIHIAADGRGRLWLAGNRGLFCVAQKEFEAVAAGRLARVRSVVYGRSEGLPVLQGSQGNWPGAWRSTDGRLWISMLAGLVAVDPSQLMENLVPPPVVLERVVVDGQTAAVYETGQAAGAMGLPAPFDLRQRDACLRLSPGPRQVELEYTGLSFVAPRNVAFKYRLEGLDHDWVDAGSRRVAYYTQIPPGKYRFQVLACNHDGVWNQTGASLAIAVPPHFWETWWFLALAGLSALVASGGAARRLERRRMQRELDRRERADVIERERTRIARDLHDEIGANLTHISILSTLAAKPSTEASASRQHNLEVASVARQTMLAFDEILWSVNPKDDTLQSLSHYLCRRTEEILAPGKVACHFVLDESFPDRPISPQHRHGLLLAVKEALHNVLKHAGASRVEVQCTMEGGSFVVRLADNGRGFDPQTIPAGAPGRPGQGLENMRRRLVELGGACLLECRPGHGTKISFRLPLESAASGKAGGGPFI